MVANAHANEQARYNLLDIATSCIPSGSQTLPRSQVEPERFFLSSTPPRHQVRPQTIFLSPTPPRCQVEPQRISLPPTPRHQVLPKRVFLSSHKLLPVEKSSLNVFSLPPPTIPSVPDPYLKMKASNDLYYILFFIPKCFITYT